MIPVITFYIPGQYEAPSVEQCRIIKAFIEYGYAINVNGVTAAPINEINRLRGFTWCFGEDEFETAECTTQQVFLLLYFNEPISACQLEAARIHFSSFCGLSSFSRKTRGITKVLESRLFDPIQHKATISPEYVDGLEQSGKYTTRIEGGPRAAEVDAMCYELSV